MTDDERSLLLFCAKALRRQAAKGLEAMTEPNPMDDLLSSFLKNSPDLQRAKADHEAKVGDAKAGLADLDTLIARVSQ